MENFVVIEEILSNEVLDIAQIYFDIKFNHMRDFSVENGGIVLPYAERYYADPFTESLMIKLKPKFEEISSKNLLPTYGFTRRYVPGNELIPHLDRKACQYSTTICIKSTLENPWDLKMGDEVIPTVENQAVFYKGCDIEHSRNKLEQDGYQIQIHLHYVDANDEFYNKFAMDFRKGFGLPFPAYK